MVLQSDIAIIIPAGGASKRMGTPKQLLPWGKITLLGHSIAQALRSEAKEVIVVLGANGGVIEKEINEYPVTILHNENWEKGMGSSIACGVNYLLGTALHRDGILVMLADQPLIDHRYLNNTLIRRFQNEQHRIIATSYGERGGVPSIFGTPYFEALSGLQDDYGAKYLIEKYPEDVVMLNPGKIIVDIDTASDYRKIYEGRL